MEWIYLIIFIQYGINVLRMSTMMTFTFSFVLYIVYMLYVKDVLLDYWFYSTFFFFTGIILFFFNQHFAIHL